MIKLLPRKEFEITLSEGTIIKGQFGTWALKKFCDDRKLDLASASLELTTLGGIIDYLLAAVEYTARKNKTAFSYTDIQASEWIDEMGGIDSADFTALIKHSGDENAATTDEKKTEAT